MGGKRGFPYATPPHGWFQIAWSNELPKGKVVPLRYFSRDMVCYRGESGDVIVMEAHCKHLGAHLGYGGTVCDDDIVCPFHGWKWSRQGSNVEIPYTDRGPHKGKRMQTWPVRELSGMVLVWNGEEDAEPTWEPPAVPEFENSAEHSKLEEGTHSARVKFYPQFVAENQVDFAHLKYVHLWHEIDPEIVDYQERGPCFFSKTTGGIATKQGPVRLHVENETWGMGYIVSSVTGLRDSKLVISVTPVDDDISDMRLTMVVRRKPDAEPGGELDSFGKSVIAAQVEALFGSNPGDMDIWENQIYIETPPYPKEEVRAFIALRDWARQFYPNG